MCYSAVEREINMQRRYYEWSMLLLRLCLGITFLAHGLQKISGFAGIVKFFASLGLPTVAVYLVTGIETIGGIALILGLFTRIAAAAISFVMLGAIFTVKLSMGFVGGYEFELSLLISAIALALSGSNILSLGALLGSTKQSASEKKVV